MTTSDREKRRAVRWYIVALISVLLGGCEALPQVPRAQWFAVQSEPQNLGQLKTELLRYESSGQYALDQQAVANEAIAYLRQRAQAVAKPAVVLDVDETSLSNWPEMVANDFGFIADGDCARLPKGPCGVVTWELSARAAAIPATLALYRAAEESGVAVFFVTGRRGAASDEMTAKTAENLRKVGYANFRGLFLKPIESTETTIEYKSRIRAQIERDGYTVLVNMGDQVSDLDGGHAERTFKLPNPYYYLP